MRKLTFSIIVIISLLQIANADMCPDGSYVSRECNLAPDETYICCGSSNLAPDGSYVGN